MRIKNREKHGIFTLASSLKSVPLVELPFLVIFSNSKWINYLEISVSAKNNDTKICMHHLWIQNVENWILNYVLLLLSLSLSLSTAFYLFRLVLNCEKEWKKRTKDYLFVLLLSLSLLRMCYRKLLVFFYSKQNKKWGKLFSFVYLYEEEVRKSFVPKKVVIVCFDFFLFRKSKYSDKISISRNHIKVEKNLWIFFHCCICVRQSLRKEVYPRLGLHLKVGARSIKVLKAYLRVESAIDRKIKRNEHETQSKFTIGATLSHVSIVSKVYMLKSKQKTFQKRKEKTSNQNRTSEEGKE